MTKYKEWEDIGISAGTKNFRELRRGKPKKVGKTKSGPCQILFLCRGEGCSDIKNHPGERTLIGDLTIELQYWEYGNMGILGIEGIEGIMR
jgi:hypothetical protein